MSNWLERENRRISKAQTLLRGAVANQSGLWADLGCGDGIFSAALHALLSAPHQLYAVDQNEAALKALVRNFQESYPAAVIHPIRADFSQRLALPRLNGLLMANALHFIRPKQAVLGQIITLLKPGGRFVLVEYNTNHGNRAVPYPLDETAFLELAGAVGLKEATIVAKIPSTFLGEMYAGLGLKAA
jgi:SAM-dependent methyltransferase